MPEKLMCPIHQPAPLLPHSGHMVLLDCITDYGEDYLCAEAGVGAKHLLLQNGSLPALAGMEIMAQGIAALAGCHAHNAGEPVRLGFLLGTRKLNLFADEIPVGTTLAVRVHASTQDTTGFGVFDCELRWLDAPAEAKAKLPSDGLLVQAALNVFSPKDGKAHL
ncbi:thioester dehydrase [Uruburuella testudinis]|uniref:Thioester dehydrase n=1 Tax=Uruburuella testudinis TaxID=1282863 RepID=A0ABY4DVN1_9NEIS|nr:thioester dehydrase [Uruburuella testudinis]UOO83101.1 thioester dehydrase [Uruburuella testudinis]